MCDVREWCSLRSASVIYCFDFNQHYVLRLLAAVSLTDTTKCEMWKTRTKRHSQSLWFSNYLFYYCYAIMPFRWNRLRRVCVCVCETNRRWQRRMANVDNKLFFFCFRYFFVCKNKSAYSVHADTIASSRANCAKLNTVVHNTSLTRSTVDSWLCVASIMVLRTYLFIPLFFFFPSSSFFLLFLNFIRRQIMHSELLSS